MHDEVQQQTEDRRRTGCASTEEPGAVVPHAGICEGGAGQPASLPQSPKSMHADHIPFLVLCGLTAGAGLFLYSTSKKLAITFIIAGFLPTVGAFSNSEDWPVPFSVELAMIIAGVAVLFALSFVVATSKRLRRSLPGQFWLMAVPSLLLGALVVIWILALTSL
jgi:hypothetical protein